MIYSMYWKYIPQVWILNVNIIMQTARARKFRRNSAKIVFSLEESLQGRCLIIRLVNLTRRGDRIEPTLRYTIDDDERAKILGERGFMIIAGVRSFNFQINLHSAKVREHILFIPIELLSMRKHTSYDKVCDCVKYCILT